MKRNTFNKKNTTTRGEISHIHFVISDPDPEKKHLIVNATSCYDISTTDYSCVLEPCDHEKITQRQIVFYGSAFDLTDNQILQLGLNKVIIPLKAIEPHVLSKIQNGARISRHLKTKWQRYFQYF